MHPIRPSEAEREQQARLVSRLAPLCACMFLGFLTVSVPLPVLPLHVHRDLGFGIAVAGLAIGIQSLATLVTRAHAGRCVDRIGAKATLVRGLLATCLAGLVYAASMPLVATPGLSLGILLAGRTILGFGESLLITGVLSWAVGRAGPGRTGTAMSWNGVAQYGALAAGAPVGLALYSLAGFGAVAATTIAAPLVALALVPRLSPLPAVPQERRSLLSVVGGIWRPGTCLMLAGLGFASLTTFSSLAFDERGWAGAGVALTAFGTGFVGVRLVAGSAPDLYGGWFVAKISFLALAGGQALVWSADRPVLALAGAALTGIGCALMFPALGVEALRLAGKQSRGITLGAFAAFQDLAIGLTGPILGVLAAAGGAASPFLVGAAAALAGAALCQAASHGHVGPAIADPSTR